MKYWNHTDCLHGMVRMAVTSCKWKIRALWFLIDLIKIAQFQSIEVQNINSFRLGYRYFRLTSTRVLRQQTVSSCQYLDKYYYNYTYHHKGPLCEWDNLTVPNPHSANTFVIHKLWARQVSLAWKESEFCLRLKFKFKLPAYLFVT